MSCRTAENDVDARADDRDAVWYLEKYFMNCFECSMSSKSLARRELQKRLIRCSVVAAGCGLRRGCKSSPIPRSL